jgi:hypothetical protein
MTRLFNTELLFFKDYTKLFKNMQLFKLVFVECEIIRIWVTRDLGLDFHLTWITDKLVQLGKSNKVQR